MNDYEYELTEKSTLTDVALFALHIADHRAGLRSDVTSEALAFARQIVEQEVETLMLETIREATTEQARDYGKWLWGGGGGNFIAESMSR